MPTMYENKTIHVTGTLTVKKVLGFLDLHMLFILDILGTPFTLQNGNLAAGFLSTVYCSTGSCLFTCLRLWLAVVGIARP